MMITTAVVEPPIPDVIAVATPVSPWANDPRRQWNPPHVFTHMVPCGQGLLSARHSFTSSQSIWLLLRSNPLGQKQLKLPSVF